MGCPADEWLAILCGRRIASSIAARAIDEIGQRLASPVFPNIACNIGADRLRVAVSGAVRCDGDVGMGPQGAVGGKRFGCKYVKRCGVEFTGFECGDDIIVNLLAAAASIDDDRRAEWSFA